MNTETSTPADERTLETVSTDRALHFDRFDLTPAEPLNRRGRRNLAAQMRRNERRDDRSLRRQEIRERAAR